MKIKIRRLLAEIEKNMAVYKKGGSVPFRWLFLSRAEKAAAALKHLRGF